MVARPPPQPTPNAAPPAPLVQQVRRPANVKPQFVLIKDPGGDGFAIDLIDEQLNSAFEAQYPFIVIECQEIGDEATRWIAVGNFFHKMSCLSGLVCLIARVATPKQFHTYLPHVTLPLLGLNIIVTGIYNLSWAYDPCCKYQVETRQTVLSKIQLQTMSETTPMVLCFRDDKYRKRLHNMITGVLVIYWSWRGYKFLRTL